MSRGNIEINQNDAVLVLKWVDRDIYDVEVDVNTADETVSSNRLVIEALYQLLKNPKYAQRLERLMGDIYVAKEEEGEKDEEVVDPS